MAAVDLPRHFTEIKLWKIYLRVENVGGTMFVAQSLINDHDQGETRCCAMKEDMRMYWLRLRSALILAPSVDRSQLIHFIDAYTRLNHGPRPLNGRCNATSA